jgi:hypothetical protein
MSAYRLWRHVRRLQISHGCGGVSFRVVHGNDDLFIHDI